MSSQKSKIPTKETSKTKQSSTKTSSSSTSPTAKSSSPSSSSKTPMTNTKTVEEFELFYGKASPFSQHYQVKFEIAGITYNCAEQYMMHQKAVLFKDNAMAKAILATTNPVEQKRFGRKVQNFDKDRWAKRAPEVVREASLAKFSQDEDLLKIFLATHPKTMVEASPRDRLWGIGLGASNPKARQRSQWKGKNQLGNILTQIREQLRKEEAEAEKGERDSESD